MVTVVVVIEVSGRKCKEMPRPLLAFRLVRAGRWEREMKSGKPVISPRGGEEIDRQLPNILARGSYEGTVRYSKGMRIKTGLATTYVRVFILYNVARRTGSAVSRHAKELVYEKPLNSFVTPYTAELPGKASRSTQRVHKIVPA
jgi:hypothetical protein